MLGLIGTPVAHSKSPAMYNHCFEKFGLDWAYLAFDVPAEKAGDAVAAIRTLRMRGANVTMPCKNAVIPYLDELTPAAKAIQAVEQKRRQGVVDEEVTAALSGHKPETTGLGSFVMALKPGDGSAREQAASCQRVLGGVANVAAEYATKRYRSNVVNWGMLPFIAADVASWNLQPGDQLWIPGVKAALEGDAETLEATMIQNGAERTVTLSLPNLTREERDIILSGCLINYYNEEM